MSNERRGDRSSLQKIEVTCKTCGVTESFYSEMSVQRFKARHQGHEVVVSGVSAFAQRPSEPKPAEPRPAPVETKPEPVQAPKPEPVAQPALEREWGTRLMKVLVDVVVFPALRDSVFRVRGFKDNLEEAFVATSRFENGEMVKRMLESGEYTDFQSGGTRYLWEAEDVEFEGDAREMLGMGPEPASATSVPAPEPTAPETPQPLEDTVARTNELLYGEPRRPEEVPMKVDSVFPSVPEAALTEQVPEPPTEAPAFEPPSTDLERPARLEEPSPPLEQLARVEEPVPPQELEIKVAPKAELKVEEKVPVSAIPSEPEEEAYLLVSKSWYIQGGEKNKKEAARISMVLKDFRWRVEPLYTIGVILDDILSIESSKGQISRALVKSIENSGYRLTAVTVDQGKPVAWFKRVGEGSSQPTLAAISGQDVLDKDEPEFEPDVAG